METQTGETEEAQPLVQEVGPSPTSTMGALVATPKPPWKKVLEAVQGLKRGTCKALQGFCRWVTTWFIPHVAVALLALILFGGWIQIQPLKAAGNWAHPRESLNAYSWCATEGWRSYGQSYPLPQAPSVRIAPGVWCNPRSPTKGVATPMRRLFPHLG